MRILVADDNPNATRTLADFLTFTGHDVQIAYDGQTALAVGRAFRPALAFLDIEMPLLDGCEVARRLRAVAARDELVLAAVTGLGGEIKERAQQAGFDHFLTKPVELQALEQVVRCVPQGQNPEATGV